MTTTYRLVVAVLLAAVIGGGVLLRRDSDVSPIADTEVGLRNLHADDSQAPLTEPGALLMPDQQQSVKEAEEPRELDVGVGYQRAAELYNFILRMRASAALYRHHEKSASKQISASDAVSVAQFMRTCSSIPRDYGEFAAWALDKYPHDRPLADEMFDLCSGVPIDLTDAARVVADAAELGNNTAKLAYVNFYLDGIEEGGLTRGQAQSYVNELLNDESPAFSIPALSMNALLNQDSPLEFYASVSALFELARKLNFDIRDFAFDRGNTSGNWSLLYDTQELQDVLEDFEHSATTSELASARARRDVLLASQLTGNG